MERLEDAAAVVAVVVLRKSKCMYDAISYTLTKVASMVVSSMRYSTARTNHPAVGFTY
ncbi:hypothetical protein LINGRAHAP2_LOCUS4581 [Linum grandiflorum]